jgi:hypothetical protein
MSKILILLLSFPEYFVPRWARNGNAKTFTHAREENNGKEHWCHQENYCSVDREGLATGAGCDVFLKIVLPVTRWNVRIANSSADNKT